MGSRAQIINSRILNGGGIDHATINAVMDWGGMKHIPINDPSEAIDITRDAFKTGIQ